MHQTPLHQFLSLVMAIVFCRAVSYALFRTQNKYHEIRTRIVYESVKNTNKYLDTQYAQQGANHLYTRGTLIDQYAM